ncbi:MAG: esterase-like activity of phytase family protein [Paracoccaceae bacterium]
MTGRPGGTPARGTAARGSSAFGDSEGDGNEARATATAHSGGGRWGGVGRPWIAAIRGRRVRDLRVRGRRVRHLPLPALLLLLLLPACARGQADPGPWVVALGPQVPGGLSAIDLGPDGRAVTLLSDRALRLDGAIERDGAGAPTGLTVVATPVPLADGTRAVGSANDIEGLALDPTEPGAVWIATEGRARVVRQAAPGAPVVELPRAPAFRPLPGNQGLEALALDPQGRPLALPETPQRGAFRVWRLDGEGWTVPIRIPAAGGLSVTGADVGPDGRLYVLERGIGLRGFRSRIRSVALDGTGLRTEWTSRPGRFGNLEGLAVWRAPTGLRATMVSDDNERAFQRAQIVEVALPG